MGDGKVVLCLKRTRNPEDSTDRSCELVLHVTLVSEVHVAFAIPFPMGNARYRHGSFFLGYGKCARAEAWVLPRSRGRKLVSIGRVTLCHRVAFICRLWIFCYHGWYVGKMLTCMSKGFWLFEVCLNEVHVESWVTS